MRHCGIANAPIMLLAAVFTAGCSNQQLAPEILEARSRLLVDREPGAASTLTEMMQRLLPADQGDPNEEAASQAVAEAIDEAIDEAIVVGRIYAGDLEPWEKGQATFLISELPDDSHGPGHDADNCPFCKRKAARAPKAVIQFVGDDGQVVGIDARQLLGVKQNDVVVVRGRVEVGPWENTLLVSADQLHIRR